MKTESIAPGVTRFSPFPLDLLNIYLIENEDNALLVDSGFRLQSRSLLAALADIPLTALALTHAHPDHQGCAQAICVARDIPLMCGVEDREGMESGRQHTLMPDPESLSVSVINWMAGPAHPVARTLVEGDEIAGFRVLTTPGHTPGHLSFYREHDRVLILGDVLFNRHPGTLRAGLVEPIAFATCDRSLNRQSIRKIAGLEPEVVCFGHGAPLRDPARLAAFAAQLRE
jgi:glyoxylase-like metal-dependent hydrolase (beta-lactamase superfamily II)